MGIGFGWGMEGESFFSFFSFYLLVWLCFSFVGKGMALVWAFDGNWDTRILTGVLTHLGT